MSPSGMRPQQDDSKNSPALRVPDEIVVEICRLNAEHGLHLRHGCYEWHEPNNHRSSIPPPLRDTINASQVCGRWRQALINSPKLWRYHINPHHVPHEWTQLLLGRARPYEITYYRPLRCISGRAEFMLEMEYTSRLVSYAGYFRTNCSMWNYEGVPTKWPQLRFLCIAHKKTNPILAWGDDGDEDEESDWLLPDDLPHITSTPLLRQLHLNTCFVGKEEQIISLAGTLTELSVENPPPGLTFSTSEWINVIDSLPRLKRLSLCKAVAEEEEWNLGRHTPPRPELEEFFLKDDIRACVQILGRLDLTRTSRVFRLECSSTGEDAWANMGFMLSSVRATINEMLSSNPLFQHCALELNTGAVSCIGIPEGCSNDLFWTSEEEKLFNEAKVEICFDLSSLPNWVGFHTSLLKLFQVIWCRVDVLSTGDVWEEEFIDHELVSIILEQSSHRILKIDGANIPIWNDIYHTIDPGPAVANTMETTSCLVQFPSALEEISLRRTDNLEPAEAHTLFKQIVAFCKRKKETENPMRVIRNPPLAQIGDSGDILFFLRRLEELGVNIKIG